jgi:phytoene dehydrogenase-like protein
MVLSNSSVNPGSDGGSYDAIVIGSGMGALTFASIMGKLRKWRVLVLERHFKIGGFTHTFSRPGGWTWDVGVHYVGEMGEGMTGRRLFDFITDGGVDWSPVRLSWPDRKGAKRPREFRARARGRVPRGKASDR